MSKKTTNEFPDFGPLNEAFGIYKASLHPKSSLDDVDRLDRFFAEAPKRTRALRRARLHWALTIASLGIVTAALVVAMNQPHTRIQLPDHTTPPLPQLTPPQAAQPYQILDSPRPRSYATPKPSSLTRPLPLRMLVFRASELEYDDTANLANAVEHDPALGSEWELADWMDLVEYSLGHPIQELIDTLQWTISDSRFGEKGMFLLTCNGRRTLPSDTSRFYFVYHFDLDPPQWFEVHAELANKQLVLGSWYGKHYKLLAVRRQTIH